MAAKDLITRARAYQNLSGVSGVDALIDTLITAVSDAIEKYCRRSFYSRTLDEVYDGGEEEILLREYPVQAIIWVRASPQVVLEIGNHATSTNQRATVEVTSTGLKLTRVASGVVAIDTSVTWASQVTLTAVATAVNSLGNGWSAVVRSGLELWPSIDLYLPPSLGDGTHSQGALSARGTMAGLRLHVDEVREYEWLPSGVLRRLPFIWWPGGVGYYRVKYTAGFSTIPEGVQQACADWVAHLYYRTLRDPGIANESTAPSGGTATYGGYLPAKSPPDQVRQLLAPYRRHTV